MRVSNLPIAWRISIAVALPLVCLCAFVILFVKTEFDQATRIERIRHFSEFSRDVSELIHELQRERGASAGYVGANGSGVFAQRLQTQRRETDSKIASYTHDVAHLPELLITESVALDIVHVQEKLDALSDHRQNVWALRTDMGQTVTPYTQTINELINLLADEVHNMSGSGSIEPMIAMLALMHAKENAGIERAVGSNSFANGQISQSNHQRALTLMAKQTAFFEEFRELMPEEWDRRLDALNAADESRAVETARQVLIDGGYGGEISSYTGPQWYDLTTQRIDLMMELEAELTNTLISQSRAEYERRQRNAFLVLVFGVVIMALTMALSTYMVATVVRPLKNATGTLKRLAQGDTDVQITGETRKDELGDMARATMSFLKASHEREEVMRKNAELEQNAIKERTQLLNEMSDQVKHATETSVGGVADMATDLRAKSAEVRESLVRAGNDADSAEASANQSLDQADRAADLASELSQAISEVTEQVTHGDALAREAVSKASASRQEVEDLQAAANQISDFVSIISGLAEQTNLLALNATIESARAGEAGKGFAVVASEVKSLAEQTNKSANEISERVQQIQARTGDAAQAISNIADSIDRLGEVTAAVAAAMEEQRASAGSFAQFVEDNRSALTQVSSQIKSMAEIARRSATDSDTMSDLVLEMAQVAEEANTSIPAIVNKSIEAAQKREEDPRYTINATGRATHDGLTQTVTIIDISGSGAGLDGTIGKVGDLLELKLGNATINAKIVVHRNAMTGLAFEPTLEPMMIKDLVQGQGVSAA